MNLENRTDEEIVLFAQKNGCKNQVVSELYKKYRDEILNYAQTICLNKEFAKEVTQETFIKLHHSFDSYKKRKDSTFKTWLYEIAKNTSLDYLRKQKTRKKIFVSDDFSDKEKRITFGNNPEKKIISIEGENMIKEELNSLNSMYSSVLKLRIEGYSCKEISEKLNISISNVKVRIFRGRKLLREKD